MWANGWAKVVKAKRKYWRHMLFWSLYSEQSSDTHGYQFTEKCAPTHKHTPLFDALLLHALLYRITPDFWLACPLSPSPPLFPHHLCVLGFVNISPLNLSVNFDRGLFLSELIPKEGNVKHCIHYWTTSRPGKPPRDIYILWPLVSPFGKQSNPKLLDSEGSNWQVLAARIVMQNNRCECLRLASLL